MSQAMIVNSANRGSTIIRHREYIGDIVATSAFTITKYLSTQVRHLPSLGQVLRLAPLSSGEQEVSSSSTSRHRQMQSSHRLHQQV